MDGRELALRKGAKEWYGDGKLTLYWEPYWRHFNRYRTDSIRHAFTIEYAGPPMQRWRFNSFEEADDKYEELKEWFEL